MVDHPQQLQPFYLGSSFFTVYLPSLLKADTWGDALTPCEPNPRREGNSGYDVFCSHTLFSLYVKSSIPTG
jgi:hypothetical protein